jgi:hypothetical protein
MAFDEPERATSVRLEEQTYSCRPKPIQFPAHLLSIALPYQRLRARLGIWRAKKKDELPTRPSLPPARLTLALASVKSIEVACAMGTTRVTAGPQGVLPLFGWRSPLLD